MNLLGIYNMLQSNEITLRQAADTLGVSERGLKVRMTKWGHRLPLLLSVLDKIAIDRISRDDAAATVNVSVREINKLSHSWGVKRPVKDYIVQRATSKVKWEIRKKYAIDFIAGGTEIGDSAERAEVSERQMRRWVSELLDKHFGMVWKDLDKVTLTRRRRLAEEIETAEGLELAKQNVLNAISRGEKTLQEEALERIIAKRARARKETHVR